MRLGDESLEDDRPRRPTTDCRHSQGQLHEPESSGRIRLDGNPRNQVGPGARVRVPLSLAGHRQSNTMSSQENVGRIREEQRLPGRTGCDAYARTYS